MEQLTRVVLAVDAPEVLEEVLHFLDRSGVAHVVATAVDPQQVAEAIRQLEPDLVIAEPRLAPHVPGATPCIALASRESVAALRAAIDAGVRAFVVWPAERDALADRIREYAAAERTLDRRAVVAAVHGSRGGAGSTFLATHLSQAVASSGSGCVLIDVDPDGSDVAAALGVPDDAEGTRPLDELAAVVSELTPERFTETVWAHPGGFWAVVAPAAEAPPVGLAAIRRLVEVAAAATDTVIVHTAHGLDPITRWALTDSDVVIETLLLDVLSFRASTRTLARLARDDVAARTWFVVNRAARAEVVPSDVERVFGVPPRAIVPFDASVSRLQDHGRLLAPRSRTSRAIARLAAQLVACGNEIRGAA